MRLLVHTALFVVTLTLSSAGGRGRGRIFDPKTFDTIDDQPDDDGERDKRLLNIFQVVRFPNSACNTTAGDQGVCYTAAECTSRSGSNSGSCASGFGVCCSFSIGCGGMTSQNNTYFVSSSEDTSPCSVTICPCDSNICQLRLDFDQFTIAQPEIGPILFADTTPLPYTQCTDAQFTAQSEGHSAPILCGMNTGYHMIVEASEVCNKLSFSWFTNAERNWKIQVSQISCKDPHKPPSGCTQYHTGVEGVLESYNYHGEVHLADQDYDICIRPEFGMCNIGYSHAPMNFRISHNAAIAQRGDLCTKDYISIPGGRLLGIQHGLGHDKYCGGELQVLIADPPMAPAIYMAGTVSSVALPFVVRFVTDGGEVSAPGTMKDTRDMHSKGFSLNYKQTATFCGDIP